MKSLTLNESISFNGVGLHTGLRTNITLKPSFPNSGIFFNRTDKSTIIPAKWDNVISTKFSTNIASNGVEVKTVEHLLSALAGLHINNCEILIDNIEVPILDGSSSVFVENILKKGLKEQNSEQKILEIIKPVKFSCDYGYAELTPNSLKDEGLNINLESSFEGKYEDQDIKIKNLNGNYIESISKARTFGFFQEIEYLKSQNLIKGGSLDNAIVIKDKKPLNKDGLRYDNELMRHKVLDVVGDLYLSGYPIIGTYKGFKTGHFITNNLLKELFKSKENYKIHKIN
jgi:UDP-3-O-[3-hydroxymyristoyl] N-acetylglucosamine deacetylase